MSLFRRKDEPATGATGGEGAPTTIPAARDPDLAMPPFRPAGITTPVSTAAPAATGPVAPKPNSPPAGAGMARSGAPAQSAALRTPTPRPETVERRTLVVGKGISLQGTVTEAERLVIEGTMESQLLQAQELIISHSGVFKGEVQVEDAEIAGVFDGTLTANGSLTIRSTGRVLGVARSRRLSVEDGGQLSGKMEMITESSTAPIARMAPAPAPRSAEPAEA
ncbi:bactofilin family protein [Neoroseomonas alba]